MPDRSIARTRRPVKDKGALMQTLHLRFRDLRAISPGQSPSRWQTPSLRRASKWETASPLPNPLGPTLAVGAHPDTSHQRLDRCPTLGAGLTMVSPFREPRVVGPDGANPSRVCWSQTAENNPHPAAHHKAGQGVGCSLQARISEVRWTPSHGLSFPLQPQRSGARACGEKTVAQCSGGSGTGCSEAPGFRPTGRLNPDPATRVPRQVSSSSCADAPALGTGQEPVGMGMPGVSHRRRARACLRFHRGAR